MIILADSRKSLEGTIQSEKLALLKYVVKVIKSNLFEVCETVEKLLIGYGKSAFSGDVIAGEICFSEGIIQMPFGQFAVSRWNGKLQNNVSGNIFIYSFL